jgi:RNAse (barnase) inhibitor barstar
MASFGAGDENALDYEVIRDGGITIYRDFRYLEEDIQWLRDKSYRIHRVDCGGWVSENDLHESLKTALAFPDYYGKNFNALNDVISDLDVPDEGGVALVFSSYDFYANGAGAPLSGSSDMVWAGIVLDILSRATHTFLLTGRRFLTMVQSNDPKMHFGKLGGSAPSWNRREWLFKNRGL